MQRMKKCSWFCTVQARQFSPTVLSFREAFEIVPSCITHFEPIGTVGCAVNDLSLSLSEASDTCYQIVCRCTVRILHGMRSANCMNHTILRIRNFNSASPLYTFIQVSKKQFQSFVHKCKYPGNTCLPYNDFFSLSYVRSKTCCFTKKRNCTINSQIIKLFNRKTKLFNHKII